MRNKLALIFIIILLFQCQKAVKNELVESDWNLTKQSRFYADYAEFIQNNPNSKHFKEAISKYLSLTDSVMEVDFNNFYGGTRYNADIDIADGNKILFNEYLKDLDSLRRLSFEYLKNANGEYEVAGKLKYSVRIPFTNSRDSISKGLFEFALYDKPFDLKSLRKILVQVKLGVDDYKNYLSKKWYNTEYSELTKEKQMAIDKLNNRRLVFFDFTDMSDNRFKPPPRKSEIDFEKNN